MRIAVDARVSTQRQSQMQTIEQQLERLQEHSQKQGGEWQEELVFRDDGYSGASLKRPGLDRLRDQASQAQFDRVLITAPDRLARTYVHQMHMTRGIGKRRLPRRIGRAADEPGPARSIVATDPWGRR
jgi:site-specific DNA recombinase